MSAWRHQQGKDAASADRAQRARGGAAQENIRARHDIGHGAQADVPGTRLLPWFGYSGYKLYNTLTKGLRPLTFAAIVDGVVASIEQADADLRIDRAHLFERLPFEARHHRRPVHFYTKLARRCTQ